ncbi:MAG: hypothetical protein AAF665_07910 [Pseudomonadota bacterium]
MIRPAHLAVLLGLCLLTGCGGSSRDPRDVTTISPAALENAPRFASGPIATACSVHNRGRPEAKQCGCIQSAANLTLSQQEQQRASRFFAEPELLQNIKLSDSPTNERFWYTWANFAETAEKMCR